MVAALPAHEESEILDRLQHALPALVLSGAGISVRTGIPTYRDEQGTWLRSEPITHREFIVDARQRQRYWGRSLLGWPGVRDARPSAAHRSLVALTTQGIVSHIVTQNVDRLHQRAGSPRVTDLHGRLDRVRCLDCGAYADRELIQNALERMNPGITRGKALPRPDGDADLPEHIVDSVQVPSCHVCSGTIMPDVVFFGGTIPAGRVDECREALEQAASLLVIGSSLQVYSGYRFCRWAAQSNKPIFVVNPGITRADPMAYRWRSTADKALSALSERLHSESSAAVEGRG